MEHSRPENEDDDDTLPPNGPGLKSAWGDAAPEPSAEDELDEEMLSYMDDDPGMDINLPDPAPGAAVAPPSAGPAAMPPQKTRAPRSFTWPRWQLPSLRRTALPAALLLFMALGAAVFFQLPSIAASRLEEKLRGAGFADVKIAHVRLAPDAVGAESIKLDRFGFDEIKTLRADVDWPSFLLGGDIKALEISGVNLGRDAGSILPDAKRVLAGLAALPDYRIAVSGVTMDITTDVGELRVIMDATITPDSETGLRDIKARIVSAQYQLGFDSSWTGVIAPDGSVDIAAEVADGRLNMGPLRISRFAGWVAFGNAGGDSPLLSAQLMAGAASFMKVPLQSLSLIASLDGAASDLIVRSGLSGMPDVRFAADWATSPDAQTFNAVLSGDNLGMMLDYIEEATGHAKTIRPALLEAEAFSFSMMFENDKRFVGGPLPFALSLSTQGGGAMSGNILIYPDTLDVRGSMETDMEMALALQDYFKIPSENMRENFIRLDGDMKRFFAFEDEPAAQ